MARPLEYVEAPPATPLPYGLFSAALVTDDLTGARQYGVGYLGPTCDPAYVAHAVCDPPPDFGTASVSVNASRVATLDLAGQPAASSYSIQWGDGETTQDPTPDGATHTYAQAGTYQVVVSDNDGLGYLASVSVTVAAAAATGPFAAAVGFSKAISDGIPAVEGDPFVTYRLLSCAPVGGIDLEARAADDLRLGEQRAAERFFASRLAATGVEAIPGAPAVDLRDGLAILEQVAAARYGGVPVVHAPRGAASRLADMGALVRGNASRLETNLGAYVAAGGGYASLQGPGGTAPGAGEAWLYATGQVTVRRAPSADVTAMAVTRAPSALNQALILAERPYVVASECIAVAVRVVAVSGTVA